jgi:hypothetical protein
VARLERDLGLVLPPDYREYLMEFNGGCFSEPIIDPPSNACPKDRLTVMAGINATERFARLGAPGVFTPATFEDNDPPQLLPIGYTMMGNLIFLVVAVDADDWGAIGMKLASSDTVFALGVGVSEFFGRLTEP